MDTRICMMFLVCLDIWILIFSRPRGENYSISVVLLCWIFNPGLHTWGGGIAAGCDALILSSLGVDNVAVY
jgi:hypothetical protein